MKEEDTYYPAREGEGLAVSMMGSIMLEYNRKPLQIPGEPSGKILRLVFILLYSGEEDVHKEKLLGMLCGNGECSNPSESLQTAVFRLRRLLEGSELPSHEYVRIDGGIYRWDSGEPPVYIDAGDFENTAEEALRTHDEAFSRRARDLYRGEFLAQPAGEKWVSVVGVRYQKLYFSRLRAASGLMKKNREYNDLLEICNYTCGLYPYKECQITRIDCLIATKRFKEAMQVYDTTASQYFKEQGLPPSEKMLERFHIMNGQVHYTSDTLKDIRDSLHEKDRINGPYYCAYPAFIDCYRLLARMAERMDFSSMLLYCTLLNARGKPLDAGGELLKTASEKPHDAIAKSLRRGDLFTCYNPSQYLVMLNGTSNEYCLWIYEGIDGNLHFWSGGRKVKLNHQIMPGSLI